MKRISMRTPATVCLLAGALTLGAAAATGIQSITATLRPDISVEVNGEKQTMYDKNGDVVYPIEYGGSTYLPIRAIGGLLDQEVLWDSKTQTVSLSPKTETPPEELTAGALTRRAEKLEARYVDLIADRDAADKAGTYGENLTIYRRLEDRRLSLVEDLREMQVDLSEAYRLELLTKAQRDALNDRMDTLDSRLVTLAKDLISKYGIDAGSTYQTLRAEADHLEKDRAALKRLVDSAASAKDYNAWKTADANAREDWKTFRSDVTALQIALNDSLRQSAISYAEYNELVAAADVLDIACKDYKATLDQAQAGWTGSQSKPDDSWTNQDTEAYSNQIAALRDRADALFVQCRDHFTSHSGDTDSGRALMSQVEALSDEIDHLEDAIEDSSKLGRQARWELLRDLDKAEDTLDKAEDFLEKAGIDDDWDDDHHDRGWHKGWDDEDDD